MAYLLDANVFMSASNLHYGFDFCPAFWEWLIESNGAGCVFSIEKVEGEIQAGGDELSDWAGARGAGFFLRPMRGCCLRSPRSAHGPKGSNMTPPPSTGFYQWRTTIL